MTWGDGGGLSPEKLNWGCWRVCREGSGADNPQDGFHSHPELGKGVSGGFVPALVARLLGFVRTRFSGHSVTSWGQVVST